MADREAVEPDDTGPGEPTPTSGNMALVSEDDLSAGDAMKLVFSGDIVPPDAISLGRLPIQYRSQSNYPGRFESDSPDGRTGLRHPPTTGAARYAAVSGNKRAALPVR